MVSTNGIDDGSAAETPAESPKVRVAGSEVPKVVVCDGTTTIVVDGSFGAAGASVSVAGTLGKSVVGDTGWTVSVVKTKGMVFDVGSSGAMVKVCVGSGMGISVVSAGRSAEAETEAVSVMLASGRSVVAAVGINVIVKLPSVGFNAGRVKVAGTFAERVVVSIGCTVTVVRTNGMLVGRPAEVDAVAPTPRVMVASGSNVVS